MMEICATPEADMICLSASAGEPRTPSDLSTSSASTSAGTRAKIVRYDRAAVMPRALFRDSR